MRSARRPESAMFPWMKSSSAIAGAAQLLWQVARVELDDPADCLAKFKSNRLFGWILLAGIVAGQVATR